MKTRPTGQKKHMLDVLDARSAAGTAAKSATTLKVKVAALAAAGLLAVSIAPAWMTFADNADEGTNTDSASETVQTQKSDDSDSSASAPAKSTDVTVKAGTVTKTSDSTTTDQGDDSAADADAAGSADEATGDTTGEATDGADAAADEEATNTTDWSSDEARPSQSDTVDTKAGSVTTNEDGTKTKNTISFTTEHDPSDKGANSAWNVFYDKDTDTYKVTYNIGSDAEGDQTIDLTGVMNALTACCQADLDSWGLTEDEIAYCKANGLGGSCDVGGQSFDVDYDALQAMVSEMPGDTIKWDVYITSDSGHTYKYQDGSFVLATSKVQDALDTTDEIIAFDGQNIAGTTMADGTLTLGYNQNLNDHTIMNDLVDKALQASSVNGYVTSSGTISNYKSSRFTVSKGTAVVLHDSNYYIAKGNYYVMVPSASVATYVDTANLVTKKSYTVSGENLAAYDADFNRAQYTFTRKNASTTTVNSAVKAYLNGTSYEQYVLDYFNSKNGTEYKTVAELLNNNEEANAELHATYNRTLTSISVPSAATYNNFYQNLLSFTYGDNEDVNAFIENHSDSWNLDGYDGSVGDYMATTLTENGAWAQANTYFNQLTESGISSDEATWVAFSMAMNLDGYGTNNAYQNSKFSWYNSIVLHQTDGVLNLTKVDDAGKVIGDDADEDQTSFYIWNWTDKNGDGLQDTDDTYSYLVYIPADEATGTSGHYAFVEYNEETKSMDLTVKTSGGSLKVDYAMLENVVYYIQEAMAPRGYDIDPNIYVLCDSEPEAQFLNYVYNAMAEQGQTAIWTGAGIKGGETLNITFVNMNSSTIGAKGGEDPDDPSDENKTGDEVNPNGSEDSTGTDSSSESDASVDDNGTPLSNLAQTFDGNGIAVAAAGGAASVSLIGLIGAFFYRRRNHKSE